jgi:hypothetical protein
VDFCSPLSALQAFSICLTSFATNTGLEPWPQNKLRSFETSSPELSEFSPLPNQPFCRILFPPLQRSFP